jgi:preprotein translocase subunit SecB
MSDTPQDLAPMNGPVIRVLAQYARDVSFENPGAPESLRAGLATPAIDLGIDVNARAAADDGFEVELKLSAKASRDEETVFIAELVYAGLFQLEDVPVEQIEPILLIDCPRLLFPFARRLLAELIREGGFPPLLVDPVDFGNLYANQLAAREPTGVIPNTN